MAKEETKKTPAKKTSTAKKSSTTKKTSTTKKKTNTVEVAKKATPKVEAKKEAPKTPAIVQEEYHFGRTLLAAILILVIFVGGYLGIKYKIDGKDGDANYKMTEDEEKFKNEYEGLNGTTRSNGQKNKDITIEKDNNIVYISIDEAAKILEDGSGVIYFGFSACPWCRNLVPVLIDAMKSSELDTIYYVDVKKDDKPENDIRDTFVLDDKDRARKGKEASSDAYYDVLLYLASYLDDYELTTEKGKKVSTGEKRLGAPTVVAVKDGVVVGYHSGTVEGHKKDESGALRDLTKDEEGTLFNTLSGIISKYLGSGCQEDGC